MKRRAVFLDRDGTVIQEAEYLADPAGVVLLPGAAEGIRRLRAAGFLALVASNQSGVARGFFSEDDVRAVNARVQALLAEQGTALDGFYYCPHYPGGSVPAYARDCDCRKPGPGLLRAAAREHDLDLARCWVVGDKASDVSLGRRHGLRAVLVLSGYGARTREAGFPEGEAPEAVAEDLASAAGIILAAEADHA